MRRSSPKTRPAVRTASGSLAGPRMVSANARIASSSGNPTLNIVAVGSYAVRRPAAPYGVGVVVVLT